MLVRKAAGGVAPTDSGNIRITRIVCDFVCIGLLGLPMILHSKIFKPYKRGFYCDDQSIRYPYKESTVTRLMCAVSGMTIAILTIIVTELLRVFLLERNCAKQHKQYHVLTINVHRIFVRIYCFLGYFLLGVCINQDLVDVAKFTIGRHRPHFIDVCRPNIGYTNCTDPLKYIDNYKCTNPDTKKVNEAQLSFYSGHSAFSFYMAWFVALYLRGRFYLPLYSRLVVPLLQVPLFAGALFIALSRISNYKHHWSDVLVGSIMGSAVGIINAVALAQVFKRREITEEDRAIYADEFGMDRNISSAPKADEAVATGTSTQQSGHAKTNPPPDQPPVSPAEAPAVATP